MLNELYTFAEPVQVVPFSSLKWGKFTLLHTVNPRKRLSTHVNKCVPVTSRKNKLMFRGRNTVEKYGEKRVLTRLIWNMDNKKAAEIQRLPYS